MTAMHRILKKITLTLISLLAINGIVIASPIPTEVKSAVVYILIERDGKLVPNGTAFFLGVKNPSNTNIYSVYLVTSRHVLYKPKTKDYLDKVFLRINKKEGGSEIGMIPLVITGDKRTVFYPEDSSVDLAVIPMLPDQGKYEYKFLPDELLTTKEDYEKLKIQEGDDVFFTGLFSLYPGAEKNHPIMRFGRVALVTDEKIEWDGQYMSLYLIEASSYGGNSGSPVFFYLNVAREPGKIVLGSPILKLAGVMQGTFLDAQEIRTIDTAKTPISVANMGIAAVVPAYKLKELLDSPSLKKARGF